MSDQVLTITPVVSTASLYYLCLLTPSPPYQTEIDLATAFAAGDVIAEKQLFTQYYRTLCAYTQRIVGDIQQAEDVATESFLKLFDRKTKFENIEKIRAFLFITARNAALNVIAVEKNRAAIHRRIAVESVATELAGGPLDVERARAEALEAIYAEIENLPGKCGQVFRLLFIDGLSTEETAVQLGINTQNVRSQKARAIQLLKTALETKGSASAVVLLLSWAAIHLK